MVTIESFPSIRSFLRTIKEKEFGEESEESTFILVRCVRNALQDVCYSYRVDPNYLSIVTPYLNFLNTADCKMLEILNSYEPPDRYSGCVFLLERIIDFVKIPQNFDTDFTNQLSAILKNFQTDISPAVLKILQSPPGRDFEIHSAKIAKLAHSPDFQNVAIRYSAWNSILKIPPFCIALLSNFPPVISSQQKEINNLKSGPIAQVDRELSQINRKIRNSIKAKRHKEVILENLQAELETRNDIATENQKAHDAEIQALEERLNQAVAQKISLENAIQKIYSLIRPLANQLKEEDKDKE
jgi:hypothetical protein